MAFGESPSAVLEQQDAKAAKRFSSPDLHADWARMLNDGVDSGAVDLSDLHGAVAEADKAPGALEIKGKYADMLGEDVMGAFEGKPSSLEPITVEGLME